MGGDHRKREIEVGGLVETRESPQQARQHGPSEIGALSKTDQRQNAPYQQQQCECLAPEVVTVGDEGGIEGVEPRRPGSSTRSENPAGEQVDPQDRESFEAHLEQTDDVGPGTADLQDQCA